MSRTSSSRVTVSYSRRTRLSRPESPKRIWQKVCHWRTLKRSSSTAADEGSAVRDQRPEHKVAAVLTAVRVQALLPADEPRADDLGHAALPAAARDPDSEPVSGGDQEHDQDHEQAGKGQPQFRGSETAEPAPRADQQGARNRGVAQADLQALVGVHLGLQSRAVQEPEPRVRDPRARSAVRVARAGDHFFLPGHPPSCTTWTASSRARSSSGS